MNFGRFRHIERPETFPARAVESLHTPVSRTACPADGIRTGLILGRSDIPRRIVNVRSTSTAPKHSHRSETSLSARSRHCWVGFAPRLWAYAACPAGAQRAVFQSWADAVCQSNA